MVAATVRKSKNTPNNTRLRVGRYIADLLLDSREPETIFHWIVQRVGSAEVLHWGQENTFAEAEEAAIGYLQKLAEKDENAGRIRPIR